MFGLVVPAKRSWGWDGIDCVPVQRSTSNTWQSQVLERGGSFLRGMGWNDPTTPRLVSVLSFQQFISYSIQARRVSPTTFAVTPPAALTAGFGAALDLKNGAFQLAITWGWGLSAMTSAATHLWLPGLRGVLWAHSPVWGLLLVVWVDVLLVGHPSELEGWGKQAVETWGLGLEFLDFMPSWSFT